MFKQFIRYSSSFIHGAKYTPEFKIYAHNKNNGPNDKIISFFHDIPVNFNKETGTVDMIVEIPRYEQGKFEISKDLPLNPIIQDTKKGKLRYINNIYPFHGYPCNYGAIPQTWEDPSLKVTLGKDSFFGDNDPLDVCEIGSTTPVSTLGDIKKVKILGCIAMIDDGELDWKILSIDVNDKLASKINDITDVETYLPNVLSNLRTWFKNYKLPMDKPENEFAFNGEWLDKSKALSVIEECNERWKLLVSGGSSGKNLPIIANNSLNGTPGYHTISVPSPEPLPAAKAPADIPLEANEIFYYKS